jgi:hypothetical protein
MARPFFAASVVAIQLISSRPVYQRGGVQFGGVPLTFTKGDPALPDGNLEDLRAILADPVIRVRVSEDGETFTDLPREERAALVDSLTEMHADRLEAQLHEADAAKVEPAKAKAAKGSADTKKDVKS